MALLELFAGPARARFVATHLAAVANERCVLLGFTRSGPWLSAQRRCFGVLELHLLVIAATCLHFREVFFALDTDARKDARMLC